MELVIIVVSRSLTLLSNQAHLSCEYLLIGVLVAKFHGSTGDVLLDHLLGLWVIHGLLDLSFIQISVHVTDQSYQSILHKEKDASNSTLTNTGGHGETSLCDLSFLRKLSAIVFHRLPLLGDIVLSDILAQDLVVELLNIPIGQGVVDLSLLWLDHVCLLRISDIGQGVVFSADLARLHLLEQVGLVIYCSSLLLSETAGR